MEGKTDEMEVGGDYEEREEKKRGKARIGYGGLKINEVWWK